MLDAAGADQVMRRRGEFGSAAAPSMGTPADAALALLSRGASAGAALVSTASRLFKEMSAREQWPPPIPAAITPKDRAAVAAIEFVDSEVIRAVQHSPVSGDLMGRSDRIDFALSALQLSGLTPAMALRALQSLSMLRQLVEGGTVFYDFTGDELMRTPLLEYEVLATEIFVGMFEFALVAGSGGLIVTGQTPERRARAAKAVELIAASRAPISWLSFQRETPPFVYIEAERLYAMSPSSQQDVRRWMLMEPRATIVFGADDLDTFIEETPRRVQARIVTYLFMDGQKHLNLNDGLVHVF